MKRTFFLTCLFLMTCLMMQAQNLQVSGTVVSKSDGLPVIGATVLELGTTNGTITDFDGKFSLSVKKGAEVVISYVGFKSQTLKANGVLNVVLEEDSEMLEEVVVTGYTTQRKADLTGAVSMVKMALDRLDTDEIVELDEEKKAAMVSNLLVVLCADEPAQPVINSGTLNH